MLFFFRNISLTSVLYTWINRFVFPLSLCLHVYVLVLLFIAVVSLSDWNWTKCTMKTIWCLLSLQLSSFLGFMTLFQQYKLPKVWTVEQQPKDLKREANVTLCSKSDFLWTFFYFWLLDMFPCTLDGWEAQIISLLTPPVVVCISTNEVRTENNNSSDYSAFLESLGGDRGCSICSMCCLCCPTRRLQCWRGQWQGIHF